MPKHLLYVLDDSNAEIAYLFDNKTLKNPFSLTFPFLFPSFSLPFPTSSTPFLSAHHF